MARIEGGKFTMGASNTNLDRNKNELPRHEVAIEPFLFGEYPFSNADYGRYSRANQTEQPPAHRPDRRFNGPMQTVVGVTWRMEDLAGAW